MVLSTALFDKPAFKNLVCNGLVLAADGKKMSKRLKNYPVGGQAGSWAGPWAGRAGSVAGPSCCSFAPAPRPSSQPRLL
jgi:hypothetical protein